MLPSIPMKRIVSINPSALGVGGSALGLNTVLLSVDSIFSIKSYASSDDVASVFGYESPEHKFAEGYFAGFIGSTKKPEELYISRYNQKPIAAKLIGASLKNIGLESIKTIFNGELEIVVDGELKTANIDLSKATSFSDAANILGTALGVKCEFNSHLQSLIFYSGKEAMDSSIGFGSGEVAAYLGLTKALGAVVDNHTGAEGVSELMFRVTNYTLNFSTITYSPDAFSLEHRQAMALWNSKQDSRFWFVAYEMEPNALLENNPDSFGSWIKENNIEGTTIIYGDLEHAALACGFAASINFDEFNGNTTMEFRRQGGVSASVTDEPTANALESNGYTYYGAYATAKDRFTFFSNTCVSGQFGWVNTYLNQIYMHSQLQLAGINLLMAAKSVPYNDTGKAMHRAAYKDPIDQMINFGGIQNGVELDELEKTLINQQAGFDAAMQLYLDGWCLVLGTATSEIRRKRAALPSMLWYTDGGSVHRINLSSINIQ